MTARVLLIGTLETKREELGYFSSALRNHGLTVELMDVSLDSQGAVWSGAEKLSKMADKAQLAAEKIANEFAGCAVAIGVGGGTGGEIVLAAMKGLPSHYPKILITTLAFDPRPMLADSAITIIPTLCDIEGLNTQLRQVFEDAAAAVSGLVRSNRVESSGRQNIAITTLGATGPAGAGIAANLSGLGYETTVFHANGYGGAAFTRFINEGYASGVVDLNVHELGRLNLGGTHVHMPDRFQAARGLPRVALPGGLNFIGLGALETVEPAYLTRPHYRHTTQFTHVKLTCDEMIRQSTAWAETLNESTAPCDVIIPMGGFSHEDRPGGAIEDAELRDVLADILEREARTFRVQRTPNHINAPETARAAADALHAMILQRNTK